MPFHPLFACVYTLIFNPLQPLYSSSLPISRLISHSHSLSLTFFIHFSMQFICYFIANVINFAKIFTVRYFVRFIRFFPSSSYFYLLLEHVLFHSIYMRAHLPFALTYRILGDTLQTNPIGCHTMNRIKRRRKKRNNYNTKGTLVNLFYFILIACYLRIFF